MLVGRPQQVSWPHRMAMVHARDIPTWRCAVSFISNDAFRYSAMFSLTVKCATRKIVEKRCCFVAGVIAVRY